MKFSCPSNSFRLPITDTPFSIEVNVPVLNSVLHLALANRQYSFFVLGFLLTTSPVTSCREFLYWILVLPLLTENPDRFISYNSSLPKM
ncbi:hypothetical protein D3C75_747140 [compost metagenome]